MNRSLDIAQLMARRLIMVGGKGGVGKSTMAATLATIAAAHGRKTLLVSTDPAHNLSDLFGCEIGSNGCAIPWGGGNLQALEISPQHALDTYLESVRQQMLPHVAVHLRGQLEKQLHLTRHAPGSEEAALLDALTRVIENREEYDLIIFDTAPTGHTLRLLNLPSVMSRWTEGLIAQKERAGRFRDLLGKFASAGEESDGGASAQLAPLIARRARFQQAAQALQDPQISAFLFVMTPEALPLSETRRAVMALESSGIPVAGIILNRLLPPEAEAVTFLRGAWACQQQILQRVADELAQVPCVSLPMTGNTLQGREGLAWLAAQLVAATEADVTKQKQPDSVTAGLS
ncbi:ArsA family ATPase [Microbulbifer elongatus]|uniref:arsenite-transporting ATPase n=1 Tax=Microbulbifer elongatus TaxID=86173 RepID=A0ABT1P0Y6_9GAMM|nr:ArsA family ATPase [Microbulbifer elongatus]MCQ3829765.1 ArsA family ATPase [Microbulbifer elongatus]